MSSSTAKGLSRTAWRVSQIEQAINLMKDNSLVFNKITEIDTGNHRVVTKFTSHNSFQENSSICIPVTMLRLLYTEQIQKHTCHKLSMMK